MTEIQNLRQSFEQETKARDELLLIVEMFFRRIAELEERNFKVPEMVLETLLRKLAIHSELSSRLIKSKTDIVREFTKQKESFTNRDVLDYLIEKYPLVPANTTTISNILSSLVKQNELEVEVIGGGRIGHIYKKKATSEVR